MINEFGWYLEHKSRRQLYFVQQTDIVRFFFTFWAIWRQKFDSFILGHTVKYVENNTSLDVHQGHQIHAGWLTRQSFADE